MCMFSVVASGKCCLVIRLCYVSCKSEAYVYEMTDNCVSWGIVLLHRSGRDCLIALATKALTLVLVKNTS